MKNSKAIISFILITFSGCSNGKFTDFETTSNGLQYKVINKSESKIQLKTGDIVELKLKYSNIADSVLFNSDELGVPFRMQINKKSHKGGCFEDALQLLTPGSRALFVIPADSFFLRTKNQALPNGIEKGSNLVFDITLVKKLDSKEIEMERNLLTQKMKELEDNLIRQYIEENKINVESKLSGLYFIEQKKGIGPIAKTGNILEVNYKGMLIDGKIFDSSYNRKKPFIFELGNHEVIDGWEEGFSYMRAGEKAKLIIPSHLAYGKEGYSSLIPPYATLIFEVELVNIK